MRKRADEIKIGDRLILAPGYAYKVKSAEVYPTGRIHITVDTGYSETFYAYSKLEVVAD